MVALMEPMPDPMNYDWFEWASCHQIAFQFEVGDNPFFREGRGSTYDEARAYCAGCPVVVDCLVEGIRDDNVGFWGGMSPNERDEMRKSMRRGLDFIEAAEVTWHRHRSRTKLPVPPARVWKEWKL